MGRKAVITGATSGIGAAFAELLAVRGYDLVLTGRRMDLLEERSDTLAGKYGINVRNHRLEMADAKAVDEFAVLLEGNEDVEVLINNAGFGTGRSFPDDLDLFLRMVDVHARALIRVTAAVLPVMLKRKTGVIINVSSLASLFPLAASGVYNASKAFVTSFSESLQMDLRREGITVQALCPGFVRTDFHERMEIPDLEYGWRNRLGWMNPDEVARYSLDHLNPTKVICIPGRLTKLLAFAVPKMPRRLYYRLATAVSPKRR